MCTFRALKKNNARLQWYSCARHKAPGPLVIRLRALFAFILCNFHVYKWENAYIKDLYALRILMNFLCIYLGEGKGWVALMHVYIWGHVVSICYRTDLWIFTKLGMDEVLMVPYKFCCFSVRSAQGRIQCGAKFGHGGPLLQQTSSSDRKATATNRMHSNDLVACWMKYCYFWFHSKVKFLMHF